MIQIVWEFRVRAGTARAFEELSSARGEALTESGRCLGRFADLA